MRKVPGFNIDLGAGDPLKVTGWEEIDGLVDDTRSKVLQDQVDHASLYRQCFATSAGRYVLEDFLHSFLMADVIKEGDEPGSLMPGVRQGQANVVKHILYMIEFANTGGGKPTGSGVQIEE